MPQNNMPMNFVGWSYFGSVMLLLLGVFQAITGLAAIFSDRFFRLPEGQLLVFNYTAWGWITLVLGILLIMAGLEMLRGAFWARSVAVLLAGLSFVASLCLLNTFELWQVVMMVVSVLSIYALTVRSVGDLR